MHLCELPFYCVSDDDFKNYLCLDKPNISMQHSVLYDYIGNLTMCHILDEVNFNYVTEVQFND